MKTRCAPGNWAIRVKANPDSYIPLGACVHVLEAVDTNKMLAVMRDKSGRSTLVEGVVWRVEYRNSCTGPGGLALGIPDEHLIPLKDGPAKLQLSQQTADTL